MTDQKRDVIYGCFQLMKLSRIICNFREIFRRIFLEKEQESTKTYFLLKTLSDYLAY